MSALIVETPPANSSPTGQPSGRRNEPDLSILEDRVPPRAKLSRGTALLAGLCGLLFTALSYQPLWHTDLWGHLAYGRWIAEHRTVPQTEPLLPLCEGVPFIDTSWLSQWIGFTAISRFDVGGIQFLYAASVTICCAALAGMLVLRTGSVFWAAVGVAVFCITDYQQLIVARPQLAGLVCFFATFAILNARRWRTIYWFLLPAVFVLWANLHGSWPIGLMLIGAFAAGGFIDVWRRTKSLRAAWTSSLFRRPALLLELCAAAVLLNPYGFDLYFEVLRVASNLNVRDLIEWDPLTLRMMQGKTAAAALIAMIVVYRLSPRRVSAAEMIALTVFGLGACSSSRIIIWLSPLAAYYLSLHGAATTRRWFIRRGFTHPKSGLWTVATAGMIWICFAYTPFGMRLLHGGPKTAEDADRRLRRAVSAQTPIDAARYLREHAPNGLVFNTYEWGDYLLWAGPPGMPCYVASHVHLVPREVWEDYFRISTGSEGWDEKLDRYGVNTVVLDHQGRSELIRRIKEFPDEWTLDYEDNVAAIFVRKKPIE